MTAYSLFNWIIPLRLAYFARAVNLFQLYSNISGFVYRQYVDGVYEKLRSRTRYGHHRRVLREYILRTNNPTPPHWFDYPSFSLRGFGEVGSPFLWLLWVDMPWHIHPLRQQGSKEK